MKLYKNKSSLKKINTRLLYGGVSELAGNGIGWWDRRDIQTNKIEDISITIDMLYAKRPDLVASYYYGTSTLEWVVLQYNNIVDVNEEFVYGRKIVIPSPFTVRMMQMPSI